MKNFILLLTFFISSTLYAQREFEELIEEVLPKTQLSNQQLKLLKEELRIQKILIQGVKELDILGLEAKNMVVANQTVKDLIMSSLGSRTQSLSQEVRQQVTEAVKESLSDKNITGMIQKMKAFASSSIHGKTSQLTSVARRFGIDAGLVYGLAMQFDYTLPLIMIGQGQVQIGATLLALPISSATTASYVLAKKAVKFRHLVKELGGVSKSIEHFGIFNKVKSFFNTNLWGKYDLIDLNISGRNYVFTVEQRNLLQRTFTKLGWNSRLNYDNLMSFVKEEGMMDDIIGKIENSKRPSQIKVLRILNQIEKSGDVDLLAKLKNRFSKYINEVENLPNFTEQRTWAVKAANSKTFQELFSHVSRMPENIPPRAFHRLWKNYILVEASKNIGPYISKETYATFRNLYTRYEKFGLELATSKETKISPELKKKFADYFYDSVPNLKACELNFRKLHDYSPSF